MDFSSIWKHTFCMLKSIYLSPYLYHPQSQILIMRKFNSSKNTRTRNENKLDFWTRCLNTWYKQFSTELRKVVLEWLIIRHTISSYYIFKKFKKHSQHVNQFPYSNLNNLSKISIHFPIWPGFGTLGKLLILKHKLKTFYSFLCKSYQ